MNARNLFASLLALLVLGSAYAEARPPVGTAKARGVFNEFSAPRSGRSMARSQPSSRHRYSTPAAPSAPMIVQTPAPAAIVPQVAQAPVEARRYSYAPTTVGVVTTSPCPTTTVVPQTGRRYSYAPAEAAAAPTVSVPRVYSGGSSYSPRRSATTRGTKHRELSALPKTDPRKFNSR
jgi:hypothetical protein